MEPEARVPAVAQSDRRVLLVGNPNVGKSVLFGALTRRYVVVSNYPGTTVEVARGSAALPEGRVEVLDLPGVNNLIPQSEDERVTRDVLLTDEEAAVLQVADAKNLRRGLLLTLGLAEMGLRFVLALNMMDEARSRGVRIDFEALSRELGVPVIPAIATRGKGVPRIRAELARARAGQDPGVDYGPDLEAAIEEVLPHLPESRIEPRALAVMALAGDEGIREWLHGVVGEDACARITAVRRRVRSRFSRPLSFEITQARLRRAAEILGAVYRVDSAVSGPVERVARFGGTVAGRGIAHGTILVAAVLLLASGGGFGLSSAAVAVAAAVIAAAIAFRRRSRAAPLVLLATLAGLYLAGAAAGLLSDLLPAGGWFRSGWVQGALGLVLIGGVLLGRLTTDLVFGTVGSVAVLYLTYLFVGVFGAGDLVDLMEGGLFGGVISPALTKGVGAVFPPDAAGTWGSVASFVNDLLVGEYGALTMALSYSVGIILPVVGTFFLVFGILEDSGYLPRLAVMMNRGFRGMGLNGKAVLPMILGLGCDTMATLTTRVLETKKERVIVTLLLALGIPCSAQLGVILGITGQIGSAAVLWWLGTVALVLFAVGWLSSKLLPGRPSDFILELPPLRVPRIGNIALKTLARIEWYLKEAVPLFFLGTLILFLLDRTGALRPITWSATPIVKGWLALPEESTPAFLIGFLRRDYGAAGLADLWRAGLLSPRQAVVALITITLFVPCVANFFIMVKERGLRTGVLMFLFIFPLAFLVGGLANLLMSVLGVLA